MSISSDDDTNSTKESDSNYDSSHHSTVDMHMVDNVDELYGVDSNGDVDLVMDGDNKEKENEAEEDEEKHD